MNKKLAVVLAALMMLSTTTFLAAGSISTTVTCEDENVVITTVSDEVKAEAEAKAAVEVGAGTVVLDVVDVEGEENVPMTLKIAGVKAGDVVYALHDCADHGWEVVDTKTGNGTVTFALHSFSTVAFVKVVATAPTTGGVIEEIVNGPVLGATPALPKTGAVAVLPVAALACLAGAVACGRKEK